jgi:uncharacterized protein
MLTLVIKPLLLVAACAALNVAFAQEAEFPEYSGHVNDFANVIDSATEQQLERLLTNFEERTHTQIAVATVKSLHGSPIEEYSNHLYRTWGIGAKVGPDKDKGALLLIALEDRKSRLEVGYGLEGDLPDGLAGEIIRRMRPSLQQQRFSEGVYTGTRTLIDTLAQKWNITLEDTDRSYAYRPSRPRARTGGTLAVWVLLFILLAAIARAKRRGGGRGLGGLHNYWWTYPIIFNRSSGSFGGGGWSSSGWRETSGGTGWGGFGGGSSGGGGASDSW